MGETGVGGIPSSSIILLWKVRVWFYVDKYLRLRSTYVLLKCSRIINRGSNLTICCNQHLSYFTTSCEFEFHACISFHDTHQRVVWVHNEYIGFHIYFVLFSEVYSYLCRQYMLSVLTTSPAICLGFRVSLQRRRRLRKPTTVPSPADIVKLINVLVHTKIIPKYPREESKAIQCTIVWAGAR